MLHFLKNSQRQIQHAHDRDENCKSNSLLILFLFRWHIPCKKKKGEKKNLIDKYKFDTRNECSKEILCRIFRVTYIYMYIIPSVRKRKSNLQPDKTREIKIKENKKKKIFLLFKLRDFITFASRHFEVSYSFPQKNIKLYRSKQMKTDETRRINIHIYQ